MVGVTFTVVVTAAGLAQAMRGQAVPPQTIATGGSVSSISLDGGRVATDVKLKSGDRTCEMVAVWRPAGNTVTHIGKPSCATSGDGVENVDSLALAGTRVAWVDYQFGNHAYCEGPFTATLTNPKPLNLNVCDGITQDIYYDFAGSSALLVARVYTQCDADCAPDYSDVYQTDVALYQVKGTLVSIGPLKRNTELMGVDAGRLLLALGTTLEVFTPKQGKNALFIALPGAFGAASLSGNDVLVAIGGNAIVYDATNGKPGLQRTLPAGSKITGFDQGIAVYTNRGSIHALRLADGRDHAIGTVVPGLVAAKLSASGLFYAYNIPKAGPKPGRVSFVPFSALAQPLGP
jgi:hypothetical protein